LSRRLLCFRRLKKGNDEEIASKAMLAEVKNAKYGQVLIDIHGFSNLPEAVFDNPGVIRTSVWPTRKGGSSSTFSRPC